jgi:hypothetical protein
MNAVAFLYDEEAEERVATDTQKPNAAQLRKHVIERVSSKLRIDYPPAAATKMSVDAAYALDLIPLDKVRSSVDTVAPRTDRSQVRSSKAVAISETTSLEALAIDSGVSFVSDIEWEGYVREVDDTGFVGVMRDVSGKDPSEKIVEIPRKTISDGDWSFVAPGAVFRLAVGSERRLKKTKRSARLGLQSINAARVYFRRFVFKSASEIAKMEAQIGNLLGPRI